ncbi:MAG TPA: hypothetical protein VG965_04020 [Patescibacteria group bacterium]|nr:hypothetical protein [Patescibacteria group bacterium]
MSFEYQIGQGVPDEAELDLSFLDGLNTFDDFVGFVDAERNYSKLQAFFDSKLTNGYILQKLMRGKDPRFMSIGKAVLEGFDIRTNISRRPLSVLKERLKGKVPVAHASYSQGPGATYAPHYTMNSILIRDHALFVDLARPFIEEFYPDGQPKTQNIPGQSSTSTNRSGGSYGTPSHIGHGAYGRFYFGVGDNPYHSVDLKRDVESKIEDGG